MAPSAVAVGREWPTAQVLVLCPNALLCTQVAGVAAGLKDKPDAAHSFLRSYQVRVPMVVVWARQQRAEHGAQVSGATFRQRVVPHRGGSIG